MSGKKPIAKFEQITEEEFLLDQQRGVLCFEIYQDAKGEWQLRPVKLPTRA